MVEIISAAKAIREAEIITRRIDEIPEDIRTKVLSLCTYITVEVDFAQIIDAQWKEKFRNHGIGSREELLSKTSDELFAILDFQEKDYRRLLSNLDNQGIPHSFSYIEKPWKRKKTSHNSV